MKVALVCTGLGTVWRGYERFTYDLFHLVKNDMNITLFKGGGPVSPREKKFPHLRGKGNLLSYALSFIPYLALHRYTHVHYSEPALGNILFHAKRKFHLGYKLLFSNGVGLPPEHCARIDHVHELTEPCYQEALRFGMPSQRTTFIPYGVHGENFTPKQSKDSLRKKYAIPESKTVILSVAALNRNHKRMDYLLREVSRIDSRFFLVVCGHVEDPTLLTLAEELIPHRYKFLTLPFEQIAEIYHAADIFVHTALEEGFCLALVEAMCAQLPVLAHHSPHFEWIIGSKEGLMDMSRPGLAQRITDLGESLSRREPALRAARQSILRRFDWKNLKSQYLRMYGRF